MNLIQIKEYLNAENIPMNKKVYDDILVLKQKAIDSKKEKEANYLWCIQQIFKVQENFVNMYLKIKRT